MKADLEITSGIVRVHEDEDLDHSGGFILSVPFIADEGNVTLKAFYFKGLTISHLNAVLRCLSDHKFTSVRWTRRGPDGKNYREVTRQLPLPYI